jgi:predicted RNase H-like HicB family nuclease
MSDYSYEIQIETLTAEDGGGYMTYVPELPGCFSDGETKDEALFNMRDAIDAWMEAAASIGLQIPVPLRHLTHAEQSVFQDALRKSVRVIRKS